MAEMEETRGAGGKTRVHEWLVVGENFAMMPCIMATTSPVKSLSEQFKSQVALLVGILVLLFAIELVDSFLPGNHPLDQWGIKPRHLSGLIGIPLAPFLHGDFAHLYDNSLPFVVLGWFVLLGGMRQFIQVTICVALCGGLGTVDLRLCGVRAHWTERRDLRLPWLPPGTRFGINGTSAPSS